MSTPTSQDRSIGLIAFQAWYDGSVKLATFTEAVANYDSQDPSFIGVLGQASKTIAQPQVIEAMQKLARDNGPALVPRSYFLGALAANSGVTTGEVVDAAADGVKTFGGFVITGLATYALVAGAVLLVLNWPAIKRSLKSA